MLSSSYIRQCTHHVLIPPLFVRIPHNTGIKPRTITMITTARSHHGFCSCGHEKSMVRGWFWKRGKRTGLWINFCRCKSVSVRSCLLVVAFLAIVQFTVWDSETPETPKTPRLPRLGDSRDSETPEAFVILLFNFPLFQIYNKTPRLPKLHQEL